MATKKYLDDSGLAYYHSRVKTMLDGKVNVEAGKGLSTNDYTNADKTKLASIASGAQVNTIEAIAVNSTVVQPDVNKTVSFSVPTSAAEVHALPDTTKYGASFTMELNSSTYIVTATLKDQDGNALGQPQTIDLPLESVVVDGRYDDTTKKVILTLQNGSTIEFSVADLVAGLQTEITPSNKLASDLVDDTNNSHKFATIAQLSKLDDMPAITGIGANINLINGIISAIDTTYQVFTGTDGQTSGTSGLVPVPGASDAGTYLKADGTWADPTYVLPIATASTLGGIKVGTNLSIDAATGILSAVDSTYAAGTGITLTGNVFSLTDTFNFITNAEIDAIVAG